MTGAPGVVGERVVGERVVGSGWLVRGGWFEVVLVPGWADLLGTFMWDKVERG
jgi:hypothetical protein